MLNKELAGWRLQKGVEMRGEGALSTSYIADKRESQGDYYTISRLGDFFCPLQKHSCRSGLQVLYFDKRDGYIQITSRLCEEAYNMLTLLL